jgi:hypothetical protein
MASKRTKIFVLEFSKRIVWKVWNKGTSGYLEWLYESLSRRMATVISAGGGHSKY